MSNSDLSGQYIRRADINSDWQCRFTVKGEKYGGSLFTKDKRKAEAKAAAQRVAAKGEVRQRARLGLDEMLFTDACDHFLLRPTLETDMPWQVNWLRSTVCAIIGEDGVVSAINKTVVSDVRMARARTLRTDHTDAKGKQHYRPVSVATVNKMISLLRRVMYHARNDRGAMIQHIKWADHMTGRKGKPKWTSREIPRQVEIEILKLIHQDYADAFCFGILCGQRAREFLHLKWHDVDLDEKNNYKNATASFDVGGGEKNICPLSDLEVAIIRRQRGLHPVYVFTFAAQRTRRYGGERSGDYAGGKLYVKGKRIPMSYSRFAKEWRKVRDALELKGVRIHDLRHTAAMRMLAETGDLAAVQRMLGHADISTTQIYAGANTDMLRRAKDLTHAKAKSVLKSVRAVR